MRGKQDALCHRCPQSGVMRSGLMRAERIGCGAAEKPLGTGMLPRARGSPSDCPLVRMDQLAAQSIEKLFCFCFLQSVQPGCFSFDTATEMIDLVLLM